MSSNLIARMRPMAQRFGASAMRPQQNYKFASPIMRNYTPFGYLGQRCFASKMKKKRSSLEQVGEKIDLTNPPIVANAKKKLNLFKFVATGMAIALAQHYYGHAENFYEYRFIAKKRDDNEESEDDFASNLNDFYGSEDFMQIYCVLPLMEQLMMRGSSFDNNGICHTWGVAGNMEVHMDFDEGEGDDCIEGMPDVIGFFNKRERFHDILKTPWGQSITLWDMMVDFGYHKRRDGTCEVYHTGVSFYGPWPIRLIFHLHSKYVIWATEKYVNSSYFGDSERIEEAMHTRENVPGWVMDQFLTNITSDLERVVEEKKKAGEHEAAMQAKQALKEIQRTKTLNLRNNTVTVVKRMTTKKGMTKKATGKGGEAGDGLTSAKIKISNKDAEKAIKNAMQHISTSDAKDTHALQHLVEDTVKESKR